MKDLKIKVNSEVENKEVQELFFEMGGKWKDSGKVILEYEPNMPFFYLDGDVMCKGSSLQNYQTRNSKETTIAELRNMVKPMKEYLSKTTYEYKLAHSKPDGDWVRIPEGAEALSTDGHGNGLIFWKDGFNFVVGMDEYWDETVTSFKEFLLDCPRCFALWVRPTQPEALPFIDDNPQSLSNQYAEIEQVRQSLKDNVNHPSHYTQGKVECLDALESATIGKSGIEAVCVANIIKYLWRYEEKNGLEDVKKANFYLNRLIATLENNNG